MEGETDSYKSLEETPSYSHYLELSETRVTFEATSKSKLTNVFYDEFNTQVFSIHSGDVTEVIVKSPNQHFCKKFKMEEKGHVVSIKFSPDLSILSVQRTSSSVDFLTFSDDKVVNEFSHVVKGPNTVLLGYMWAGLTELIFITDQGIRLCRVDPVGNNVSILKNVATSVNWFSYFSPLCLLLVSSGPSGNAMKLFLIRQNQIMNVAKFDLDIDLLSRSPKSLSERDVVLGVIYNLPRILIMNYQTVNNIVQAELVIYTIIKLSVVKKTHVLRINQPGRFAVNLVDNLIIVHNQVSKTSLVFDITESEFHGAVSYHSPIAEPKSIKPIDNVAMGQTHHYDLYSPNWVMFQPNIVMDAKLGCLWNIELNLFGFLEAIPDNGKLIGFLLLRANSRPVIAKTLEKVMAPGNKNMEEVGDIFDQLNSVYRSSLEMNMRAQLSLNSPVQKTDEDNAAIFKTVIDENFMYTYVFSKLDDKLNTATSWKQTRLLSWVLLEYIRSLVDFQIPVQHFLYELLINSLVMNGNYYQLHQLLQYHAVSDSKPLACLLLSLENLYPAASQLAIDMLERLGCAKEEITEILLSKQQLLSSLRYNHQYSSPDDRLSGMKYLDAAQSIGNEKLFYTVLTHFNLKSKLRNGN